jgi:hypothetical protein
MESSILPSREDVSTYSIQVRCEMECWDVYHKDKKLRKDEEVAGNHAWTVTLLVAEELETWNKREESSLQGCNIKDGEMVRKSLNQ